MYPGRDGNPAKFAVKGLSLAVTEGECFGMLGPNGAGKTSFISMVSIKCFFALQSIQYRQSFFMCFHKWDHQGSISVPEIIWGIFHPIN